MSGLTARDSRLVAGSEAFDGVELVAAEKTDRARLRAERAGGSDEVRALVLGVEVTSGQLRQSHPPDRGDRLRPGLNKVKAQVR